MWLFVYITVFDLKKIREDLIENRYIDFSNYDTIKFILVKDTDKYKLNTSYNTELWKIVNDPTKNVLVLDPISSNIDRRINFIKKVLKYVIYL